MERRRYDRMFDFDRDGDLDRGERAAMYNYIEDEEKELWGSDDGDDDYDDYDSGDYDDCGDYDGGSDW